MEFTIIFSGNVGNGMRILPLTANLGYHPSDHFKNTKGEVFVIVFLNNPEL